MRKFIGIDLHSNNSVVVVADEDDRVVYQKRLPNDLAAIAAALVPHRDETVGVVIESTYNWYWLVDGLMDAGYRVHLAHPAAITKYEGLKHSGDFADAAYLAQLLRLGLLAEGYVYPREQRGARDLARKRISLTMKLDSKPASGGAGSAGGNAFRPGNRRNQLGPVNVEDRRHE